MKKIILLLPLISLLCIIHANSQTVLQKDHLQYMGAFKVPLGEATGSSFSYGGTAPVYNPANNSLFMVGHEHHQMVAEITIPEAVNNNNLAALNRASFLQTFTDITEGTLSTVDPTDVNGFRVGGLLLHNGTLINSAYAYYDANSSQVTSHFKSSPDWSRTGEVEGAYQLGTLGAGFVSGYMTQIPSDWQADFGGTALTGNCCISIISRSSYGPSVSVFDPDSLGVVNPVPTTPLLYYPQENPLGDWDATSLLFNGSTQITGVVFPENSQSVLFFGRHGTGTFCYGTGEICNDPVNPHNGTHAYPYIYQVWAYDASDLLAVKNGTRQAWEIQPYATWELELPLSEDRKVIGGVAYNREAGLIYLSQQNAEELGKYPVMHVFKINTDDDETTDNTDDTNSTISCECDPLPAPTNTTIRVSTVTELRTALQQANTNNGNMTILLEDGTYELENLIYITQNMTNMTFRSVSGNRDAVIIRGQGMTGNVNHIFSVLATNFTLADMTIGWVANHVIQIHAEENADNCLIQNVRLVDAHEQLLKVSGTTDETGGETSDNGIIQCCLFEFTAGIGNQWYTGGIDGHKTQNWIVRNNTFKHIRSPEARLAEHAIHFRNGAVGTIVENNLIINCDRGIGFGLGNDRHEGGIIRNNIVHTSRDVGIGLESASNAKVYNNTVITDNYPRSIEYRFTQTTNAHIANNLTTASIATRDGGTGTIENNFTTSDKSIFVDADNYNFHLSTTQNSITNAGKTLPEVRVDYDCDNRSDAPDIGADEYESDSGTGDEDQEECQLERTHSNEVLTAGVYPTKDHIYSQAIVESMVTYKAGNTITLQAGFYAKSGSEFSASIENCEDDPIPPTPQISINGPMSICPDESTILEVGSDYANYNWSTGAATSSITVNQAGTYSVTVTNNAGLSGTDSQEITATNSGCEEPPTGLSNPSNTVSIRETEGNTINNHPMQLGRPFVRGEIADYPQVLVNGTPLLTQANVKTRWEDGSVKHAILNFIIPQIPANGTLNLSFQNQTNGHNSNALSNSQMLDSRFNFEATIQIRNTAGIGANIMSARHMLQNGDFEYWLEGEIATSVILADHSTNRQYDIGFDSHRSFRPIFHATFWHQLNQVEVRYIGEVVNTELLQDFYYDLSIHGGDADKILLYEQSNITHHVMSRWTKKFWLTDRPAPKLNINHNLAYLAATTLIPNYNTSITIPESVIVERYGDYTDVSIDKTLFGNGLWAKYMPRPGGRPEIGPYPDWTVRWLYTGDWRDYEEAFVYADLAAAWPYHLREGRSDRFFDFDQEVNAIGRPVSMPARPTLWAGRFDYAPAQTNQEDKVLPLSDVLSSDATMGGHGWVPDKAHQPDPFSPQYLLSGEYWYLEEMQFLASYSALSDNHGFRGIAYEPWGGIVGSARAAAWVFRNRVQTAVYSPDGTIEKDYFSTLTEHAIAYFEGRQNLTGTRHENTPLWINARDQQTEGRSQFNNPLHYWHANFVPWFQVGCHDSLLVSGINQPWMNNFMLYALGRAEELGFEVSQLKDWAGVWLVEQLTNPGFNPYLCAAYSQPQRRRSDGRYFETWEEVFDAYCADLQNDPERGFVGTNNDPEHGYTNIAMAASSFYTNLPNGQAAWEWIRNNAANNPRLIDNPKWALIPRTATASYVPSLEERSLVSTKKATNFQQNLAIAPNPTGAVTTLYYELAASSTLTLDLYDVTGKKVRNIIPPTSLSSGKYQKSIDVSPLNSGMYFVVMRTQDSVVTEKIMIQ